MKQLTPEQQATLEQAAKSFGMDGILLRLQEKCLWMALQTLRFPRKVDQVKLCVELGYLTAAIRQAEIVLGRDKVEMFDEEAIRETEKVLRRSVPK